MIIDELRSVWNLALKNKERHWHYFSHSIHSRNSRVSHLMPVRLQRFLNKVNEVKLSMANMLGRVLKSKHGNSLSMLRKTWLYADINVSRYLARSRQNIWYSQKWHKRVLISRSCLKKGASCKRLWFMKENVHEEYVPTCTGRKWHFYFRHIPHPPFVSACGTAIMFDFEGLC